MEANSIVSIENKTTISLPLQKSDIESLLELISANEQTDFALLEVVYVDEKEIIRINNEHLDHNYITDIITFNYHDPGEAIEGTLFCCAPRIVEQSKEYADSERQEFLRLVIHGMLHLCGYKDNDQESKHKMTKREDHYLELFNP